MTARLIDTPAGVMASTLVKYDEHGRPIFASDVRLGNRRQRRHLMNLLRHQANDLAQRAATADAGT
jgi:hypothetical protein